MKLLDRTHGLTSMHLTQLLQNLTACLSVGQFDRAESIVRKIASSGRDPTAVLEANNVYLRGLLKGLSNGADGVTVQRIQKWLEIDMRQLDLSPNATTFALVCRALFLHDDLQFKERMFRRYLYMAEGMGMLDATLSSGEYTPYEWNELCRVRSDIFDELPGIERSVPNYDGSTPNSEVSTSGTLQSSSGIIPTLQRGLGLQTLTRGLQSLLREDGQYENVDEATLEKWQMQLESDMIDAELERWQMEHTKMLKMGINPALSRSSMRGTLWHWKTELEEKINSHITNLRNDQDPKAWLKGHGQYFEQIPTDKLAAITIMTTFTVLHRVGVDRGAPAGLVISNIGSCLEIETLGRRRQQRKEASFRFTVAKDRKKEIAKKAKPQKTLENTETGGGSVENRGYLDDVQADWTHSARVSVSAFLLSKFIEVARYPEESSRGRKRKEDIDVVPAFTHEIVWFQGKKRGMIKVSNIFKDKLIEQPTMYQNNATMLPMISKPEPWTEFRGAYLRAPASVMRVRDNYGLQDVYIHAAIENGDIDQVLAALNVLSQTPWRINKPLLDVMIAVWNTGEPLTNFPPANPIMEYPPEPEDEAAKRRWRYQVWELNNLKSGYQSNRCFINLQLEIAAAFSGYDIYCPHNLDWRGRAYPVPGILNHMGADNARALFMFSKGKELGEEGLDWLKIHLANTFGFDKASFEERRQFPIDHLDDIRDSVEHPLDGRKWWMTAEDPWQCLATCMEYIAAIDSPDPTKYISHLPVHQDGTCNGLQHYAALGGDVYGAAQVNLVPADRPADIYSEVAKLVRIEIEKDAEQGNPKAKALRGLISRKVVKQPVMTNVYGVTFTGAMEQVKKRLDEIISISSDAEFSNRSLAAYIVHNIFKVFGDMFAGATRIQHWLAECASTISTSVSPEQIERAKAALNDATKKKSTKKRGSNSIALQSAVVWTTPLKLPVVQPYRDSKTRSIKTILQYVHMRAPMNSVTVVKRKQMQGFPPNFIHSLDATHMMLSALKCNEVGLSFAAVHDCFWTHACDVPKMNAILRDAFVHMHSEDIITRLAEEFKERYKNFLCVRTVYSKSPLGKKIRALRAEIRKRNSRDSIVRLSRLPSLNELVDEYERLRLLQSDDPKEREKGENMITPGSLFATLDSSSPDLLHPSEVVEDDASTDMTFDEQIAAVDASIEESEALTLEADASTDNQTGTPTTNRSTVELSTNGPKPPSPKKKKPYTIKFWAATSFPAVPPRGDFDVTMLKQSEYFFS
jgi:DNA-directed RNA polymerase, mitochondrial